MKKNYGLFNPRGTFMRISLIFCLLSTLCITLSNAATVHAQQGLDKTISISLKESSFPALLKEIEKKTGVSFIYTNKENISNTVTVNDKAKTARTILEPLLKKYNLKAIENGLFITLRKVEPKPITEVKPGSVVGYVKDQANNQTLPYATVLVKGTNQKTTTDVNGYFVLTNIAEGKATLRVTYLGFKAEEVAVNIIGGKISQIDVKLTSESNMMKGITITGIRRGEGVALNNMQNADNVKYVLSEEQIERFPDATVGEAMQRVPGIAMDYSYGLPRNIIIRGLDQSMGLQSFRRSIRQLQTKESKQRQSRCFH